MNTEPHEITPACMAFHCYSHEVDEPRSSWLICGECWHGFSGPADLLKQFNIRMAELELAMATSAEEIDFCPFCSHNF